MNAVERLLAHAGRVAVFFDEMLARQDGLDPRTAESVHRNLAVYTEGGPYAPPAFELKTAPPRYRKALTADRLNLLSRWQSESAIATAIARAVEEAARVKKRHGEGADLSPRALEIYCDLLAEREQLLDPKPIQSMVADVVAESLLWGPHAVAVVDLSKSLAAAIGRLLSRPLGVNRTSDGRPFMLTGGPLTLSSDWLTERAKHLQPAIDALRIYARPPAPAATSEPKPGGTKQAKRRDRKGIGGPKFKYSDKLVREVVAARKRDEKHAAKSKRPLPRIPEWLSDYFTNVAKLPLSTLPSKDPKKTEEWSIRAKRFWKAANTRLKRARN